MLAQHTFQNIVTLCFSNPGGTSLQISSWPDGAANQIYTTRLYKVERNWTYLIKFRKTFKLTQTSNFVASFTNTRCVSVNIQLKIQAKSRLVSPPQRTVSSHTVCICQTQTRTKFQVHTCFCITWWLQQTKYSTSLHMTLICNGFQGVSLHT